MVFRHVLLHLRGLFPALSTWTIAGYDRRKNSFWSYFSNIFAGNFCGHGNSKSDAFFVACPACGSQPLGEYCVRHAIHRDHDSGDPGWLAFLHYLRIDRNRTDRTYRLVRMVLAEASGGNRVIVDMSAHFQLATNL